MGFELHLVALLSGHLDLELSDLELERLDVVVDLTVELLLSWVTLFWRNILDHRFWPGVGTLVVAVVHTGDGVVKDLLAIIDCLCQRDENVIEELVHNNLNFDVELVDFDVNALFLSVTAGKRPHLDIDIFGQTLGNDSVDEGEGFLVLKLPRGIVSV